MQNVYFNNKSALSFDKVLFLDDSPEQVCSLLAPMQNVYFNN